jgi:hypothetical protein
LGDVLAVALLGSFALGFPGMGVLAAAADLPSTLVVDLADGAAGLAAGVAAFATGFTAAVGLDRLFAGLLAAVLTAAALSAEATTRAVALDSTGWAV